MRQLFGLFLERSLRLFPRRDVQEEGPNANPAASPIANERRVNLHDSCGPVATRVFSFEASQSLLARNLSAYGLAAPLFFFLDRHEFPDGTSYHFLRNEAQKLALGS